MSLLKNAKARAPKKEAASKKETVWTLPANDPLNAAVTECVKLSAESKAIEGKLNVYKNQLKVVGQRNYVETYTTRGSSPETPMLIQNGSGESVTYIVQDRSSQYGVKEDQLDALRDLLGADAAERLTYEETTFKLSRDVLALPGVLEAIDKALTRVKERLVESKVLTDEQGDLLVEAESKTAFRPGTLDRMVEICGRDSVKMASFLDIMGSSATRYVKP